MDEFDTPAMKTAPLEKILQRPAKNLLAQSYPRCSWSRALGSDDRSTDGEAVRETEVAASELLRKTPSPGHKKHLPHSANPV